MSPAFFLNWIADWWRATFHFIRPRDLSSEKVLNPGLDLHWLLQSPWFKLSWIAWTWTWMQDNDLVYLSNLSESELYLIVQLHQSSELIFLEHYNGSYEGQFIFPCLRSSLHQTTKCSGHSWARIKMTHDREFILSGFYFILFYFISLTTQSYPSDCLSVCQSTSFMIFPTSPTFQTFFRNKKCSPSLRQGERGKVEWFQFIHPTNGHFTWLLISCITLLKWTSL